MKVKTDKFYVWCGVAALVLIMIGFLIARLIPPPSPNESAAEVAAFYRHHTTGLRLGLIVAMFGGALLGPWVAVMAKQFKRIEGPNSPVAYCQLALGALLPLEIIVPLMLMAVAAFRSNRSPAEILAWSDASLILLLGLVFTFVVELLLAAVTILGDESEQPLFPRWVAGLNVVVALLSAPACLIISYKTGPFAWDGAMGFWVPLALFGAWMLVVTFYLLQAVDRLDGEGAEVPGEAREIDRLAAEVASLREEIYRRSPSS